ncbi:phosphatidate cytidylyltransferase [Parasphingorhabdus sp. DH2-15]|uniref:phosphatidate cytidylyltransferase n=1 Tax=Parasphingorhabdus sp. DH2-15 TaxID=3444112 RepID=UPI003F687FBA
MSNIAKNSDLPLRAVSGVIMAAIALLGIWIGGAVFTLAVSLIGVGIYWEFAALVRKGGNGNFPAIPAYLLGAIYIGLAVITLIFFRHKDDSGLETLFLLLVVVATDIGAYFAGRALGGPKLAPRISPNKTWAGLIGGMVAATIVWTGFNIASNGQALHIALVGGAMMAFVAQMGDLLQSAMKRRAGVKDSGTVLPGHGGLFDRTDGMVAVFFVVGLTHITLILQYFGIAGFLGL